MRITYAVYLETSLAALVPEFWRDIQQHEFSRGLDEGGFRTRQEITRVEYEGVTDENRARVREAIERFGKRLAIRKVRELAADPHLDVQAIFSLAHISTVEVEDAPNPKSCHGMEGENPAVTCPSCQAPMKQRSGSRGVFWGCSRFPACRGVRRISQ